MTTTVPEAAARLCDAVALAAVAGEHVLVIGPPGTVATEEDRERVVSLDLRTGTVLRDLRV